MLEDSKHPHSYSGEFLMSRLVRSFLLAGLLLAVSALRAEEAMPTTPYYPLEPGTTWTYKSKDGKFVMKVEKMDKVGNHPCARVVLLVDEKDRGQECISVTNNGVYRNAFGGALPDNPVCILKLPLKAGDSWEIKGTAMGDEFKGKFKVGEEKEIKVPAGTYKAFPVTSEDLSASGLRPIVTSYYASGVGLVRQELKINTQETVIELEKFEPGKK
jgi:hypothetical protein